MADETVSTDPEIIRCLQDLKSKIPVSDHAALASRLQALINDPEADNYDVVSILRQEFGPAQP
jgi:hypothetical protein